MNRSYPTHSISASSPQMSCLSLPPRQLALEKPGPLAPRHPGLLLCLILPISHGTIPALDIAELAMLSTVTIYHFTPSISLQST